MGAQVGNTQVRVTSIFGAATKQGLVQLGVPGEIVHISPTEARQVALTLLEAAEAAETDELLYRFVGGGMRVGEEAWTRLLRDFRHLREEFRTRDAGGL
jgi:hypothetical protein